MGGLIVFTAIAIPYLVLSDRDTQSLAVFGVALGFANVVRPGPVWLVAASGTGSQQVSCLLDMAGVGFSHVLGVGVIAALIEDAPIISNALAAKTIPLSGGVYDMATGKVKLI